MTGEVKSFSSKHGYGFITANEKDHRFKSKQWELRVPPTPGMIVEFDPILTEKGARAINIRYGV